MDLNSLLNSDAPARPSSSPHPPLPPPERLSRAPPPPLQPSHSPYHSPSSRGPYAPSPQHPPPQSQPQRQSPYHASPPPGYPFPPPSPRAAQTAPTHATPQHTHQGYGQQSPVGTPHPLSAHSTLHSTTPTSASSQTHFGHAHPYTPLPPHHPPPPPHPPVHTPPVQASPSPISQYPPHHRLGYPPRHSPIASPVEARYVQPASERVTPAIAAPVPRDQRERERSSSYRRERDRDISVSPKTKVPYLADDDAAEGGLPRERPGYGNDVLPGVASRPGSQHQHQPRALSQHSSLSDFGRRSSVVNPADRRSLDVMDVDGEPGPDRKWASPVSDRPGRPNGASAPDSRLGHAPPQPYANSILTPTSASSPHHQNNHRPPPAPSPHTDASTNPPPPNSLNESSSMPHPAASPAAQRSTPTPTSKAAPPSPKRPPPPQSLGPPPTPTQQSGPADGQSGSPNSTGPPRKRPRRDEAPIWARKASRSSSSSPVMSGRRHTGAPPPGTQPAAHPPPHPANSGSHDLRPPPPPAGGRGPPIVPGLGPWEPSIVNQLPLADITQTIGHWLFEKVVEEEDPHLAANGGAMFEIEAKIGHIIDRKTNNRLHLPVLTETVIDDNDPSFHIMFRSSMNESQHRRLNDYLNKAFTASKLAAPPDQPSRIPLEYVHTRERDSFFELPADKYQALPKRVLDTLNPRQKPRVRVTTDPKTNAVLKTICKVRLGNLNIYSPATTFDWRISVNMEMPIDCDHETMYALGGGGDGDRDRNKDRLSYRHLAYQIDLTQVQTEGKNSKKEHELEVEVDAKEIRKHGLLVKSREPNGYERLVEGLINNVRTLIQSATSSQQQ